MAKWLAIDVDQGRWRLAVAAPSRSSLRIERLEEWVPPHEPIRTNGETLGANLRDFLKAKDIPPLPVLVTFGRERVFLKELRYPALPAADEAQLVRFQATKDLPDSSDPAIVDYLAMNDPKSSERETLAVAMRRGWLQATLGVLKGAGLKTLGAAPRFVGFGGLADFANIVQPTPFLGLGEHTSELTILVRSKPLLARALPAASSSSLPGEVQRSLALFRVQHPECGPLDRLHVLGEGIDLADKLGTVALAPFPATIDAPRPLQSGEWAALGAAYLWQRDGKLPINLAAPRDPKPGVDPNRRKRLVVGIGVALSLAIALVALWYGFSRKNRLIAELKIEREELEEKIKLLDQDRTDNLFFKDWEDTSIVWVDEIHELASKLPRSRGFRLSQILMAPSGKRAGKDGVKDPMVAKMNLHGIMKTDQDVLVSKFQEALNQDKHLRASLERFKGSASGSQQDFQLKVDVARPIAASPPGKGGKK